MNDFGNGLIIGTFFGSIIGVALMALLAMAKDKKPPKREPEQKEPTTLWAKGNLCMWKGKLCEIERFDTTANNHTVVHLRREGLNYGFNGQTGIIWVIQTNWGKSFFSPAKKPSKH